MKRKDGGPGIEVVGLNSVTHVLWNVGLQTEGELCGRNDLRYVYCIPFTRLRHDAKMREKNGENDNKRIAAVVLGEAAVVS